MEDLTKIPIFSATQMQKYIKENTIIKRAIQILIYFIVWSKKVA